MWFLCIWTEILVSVKNKLVQNIETFVLVIKPLSRIWRMVKMALEYHCFNIANAISNDPRFKIFSVLSYVKANKKKLKSKMLWYEVRYLKKPTRKNLVKIYKFSTYCINITLDIRKVRKWEREYVGIVSNLWTGDNLS